GRERCGRGRSSAFTNYQRPTTNHGWSSVLRNARCARVRNRVADIRQPADVDDQALEAEAEAGVRDGAVAAEVAVPGVVLAVEAELVHARIEHVQAFF